MMGKYEIITAKVHAIFGSTGWNSEGVKTYPEGYTPDSTGNEFIRVNILNGKSKLKQVSGQVLIEIYTPAGNGPKRTNLIADILDKYLEANTFKFAEGSIQFEFSSLSGVGIDREDSSLNRALYSINFNFFGA